MDRNIEELKAEKEKIIKELINEINTIYKDYTKEERLEKLKFILSHQKELLEMDEIFKCREKNFKELKKRLPNSVMSFDDLDDLLEDNGYYSMFSLSFVEQNANKFKVTYKAVDNCHYDLRVTFVIGANTFKKILKGESKEEEDLFVMVTDVKRI